VIESFCSNLIIPKEKLLIFVIIDKPVVILYSINVIPVERQQQLIALLRSQPGLAVPELAERLQVSPGTIRNDLRSLAGSGQVVRVRGGGTVLPDLTAFSGDTFAVRGHQHEQAKQAIGRVAAGCIQDGESILLDASTTVFHMAKFLVNRRRLRVVTNGIEVARLLSQNPSHLVMVVGGTLRAGTQSMTGPWSLRYLDEVNPQHAFIACSGFTPENGMTEVDIYEAEFRIKAIRSATQIIALIDSSKFGQVELTPSVRPGQITHIYTDSELTTEWQSRLSRAGVPFTLCE
jgi:DeoR/GlpR family transcriptional regulator of sugar metabolism